MSSQQDVTPASDHQNAVTIPPELLSRVESRLSRTDFETADEYVTFVLEEVLAAVEAETEDDAYGAEAQAEVEKRLESLGYLDS